jgi:uncharacterized glyoxalase superfamily protein PhnB
MSQVKPIPEGFHSVTPHLCVKGAAKAIDFYKQAFGAEEISSMSSPDGRVLHAEIKIGDSIVMLADEFPEMGQPVTWGNSPVTIHLFVPDADAVFERAVAKGATVGMPIQDMFWGDRYGSLKDPFGHNWSIATRKRDLSEEEIAKAAEQAFAAPR